MVAHCWEMVRGFRQYVVHYVPIDSIPFLFWIMLPRVDVDTKIPLIPQT